MKTLRNFIFWAYQRGSFQYDIMVTLILLFIFVTPHLWNYGDRPNPKQVSEVMVDGDGVGNFVYQIRANDVDKLATSNGTDAAIHEVLGRVAGDVQVEKWVAVPGPDKRPVAYKVWAHR